MYFGRKIHKNYLSTVKAINLQKILYFLDDQLVKFKKILVDHEEIQRICLMKKCMNFEKRRLKENENFKEYKRITTFTLEKLIITVIAQL